MALFDTAAEHPPDRIRRYVVTTLVFIALVLGASWYLMRFHTEKRTARHFMDTVVAGNMEEAYKLWKPSPSYSYKDFLDDWGPQGYYGPVRSYRIEDTQHVKNGSGLGVVLDVSPYTIESHRTKLMQKLNIHNTAEIVLYAVRKKLVS